MVAYNPPSLPPPLVTNVPSHRPHTRLPDLLTHVPGGFTIHPSVAHDPPRTTPQSSFQSPLVPLTPDSSSCSSPCSRRGSDEVDDDVPIPPLSNGTPWSQTVLGSGWPPSLPPLPPLADRPGTVPRHLAPRPRLSPLDTTSAYCIRRTSHSRASLRVKSESMSPTSPAIANLPTSATTAPLRTRTTRKRGAPTEAPTRRVKRERPSSIGSIPSHSAPLCPTGGILDEDTDGDELTSGEKKRLNEKQNRRELTDAIGGIQTTLLAQGVRFDIDLLQNHNQRTSGLRFKKVETLTRAHSAILQGSRLAKAIERLSVPDMKCEGREAGPQASWMSEKHVDELIRILQRLAERPASD